MKDALHKVYAMISCIWSSRIDELINGGKSIGTVFFCGWGQELIRKEYMWPLWSDNKVLYLVKGLSYMGAYVIKTQWI